MSSVVAIFALGAVYTSLNTDLATAQDTSEKNKEKLEVVADDLANIKINQEVIKARQEHMAEELRDASQDAKETQKDVKEILRILGGHNRPTRREEYYNGNS